MNDNILLYIIVVLGFIVVVGVVRVEILNIRDKGRNKKTQKSIIKYRSRAQ